MREWLCVALAATSIACSGGRDPVRTVGGDWEHEGPGTDDPYGPGGASPTTSLSTVVALCTKACAHVRAADCEGAPAYSTDQCELQCESELGKVLWRCADESAAVYQCTIHAKVTCSGSFGDMPMVTACDTETSELKKCQAPGSDCVVSPQNEDICNSLDLPVFLICSEGIEPPPNCVQIASDAYCCG
jgi:hypothetical protein